MIEQLIAGARQGVDARRRELPQADLESRLSGRGEDRPFNEALVRPGLSLIAEFKRRSPSAGEISATATVAEQVRAYERGGAAALSVLTDEPHFGGSLDDLRAARAACGMPIIRKDFIVDPYQLYEAAINGADAVLLIVRALDDESLRALYDEARSLDLDCLVEVHDGEELERALEARRRGDRDQQPQPRPGQRRPGDHLRADARRAGRQDRGRRERHLRPRRAARSWSGSASTPSSSAAR